MEAGANESWPKGAEVKMITRSIQKEYAYYADKQLYVYIVNGEDDLHDAKVLC